MVSGLLSNKHNQIKISFRIFSFFEDIKFFNWKKISLTIMPFGWLLKCFIHLEFYSFRKFCFIKRKMGKFEFFLPLISGKVVWLPAEVDNFQLSSSNYNCLALYSMVEKWIQQLQVFHSLQYISSNDRASCQQHNYFFIRFFFTIPHKQQVTI